MTLLTILLLTCGIFFLKKKNPLISVFIRLLKINEANSENAVRAVSREANTE